MHQLSELEGQVLFWLFEINFAYRNGLQSFLMDYDACLRAWQGSQDALLSFSDYQSNRNESDAGDEEEPEPSFLMNTKSSMASTELAAAMQLLHQGQKDVRRTLKRFLLTYLKQAFNAKLGEIRLICASRLHHAKKTLNALRVIEAEEPKRVRTSIEGMQKVVDHLAQIDYAIREACWTR
jgi:hypothetical protein